MFFMKKTYIWVSHGTIMSHMKLNTNIWKQNFIEFQSKFRIRKDHFCLALYIFCLTLTYGFQGFGGGIFFWTSALKLLNMILQFLFHYYFLINDNFFYHRQNFCLRMCMHNNLCIITRRTVYYMFFPKSWSVVSIHYAFLLWGKPCI